MFAVLALFSPNHPLLTSLLLKTQHTQTSKNRYEIAPPPGTTIPSLWVRLTIDDADGIIIALRDEVADSTYHYALLLGPSHTPQIPAPLFIPTQFKMMVPSCNIHPPYIENARATPLHLSRSSASLPSIQSKAGGIMLSSCAVPFDQWFLGLPSRCRHLDCSSYPFAEMAHPTTGFVVIKNPTLSIFNSITADMYARIGHKV